MKSTQESPIFFNEMGSEWENAGTGIKRQIVAFNADLMLVKVKFEKGAIGEIHHHIHTQGSYIASGKFKVTINGIENILKEGDGFYVPPNTRHGAECLESGVIIDCFNPLRDDFF